MLPIINQGRNAFMDMIMGEQGDDKSEELLKETLAKYENIDLPELEESELQGIAYEDMGYDPIGSAWDDVATDPALRDKQLASIAALENISDSGGFNLMDQANLNRIQSQAGMQDRARKEAIGQQMAMRGMSGGGQDLLAQLQSSQAATNQANQQGMDVAAMGQQRALDAIAGAGQMSGAVRGQDFGEQGQRANSLDAISQFNKANQMSTGQFNKQMGGDAQRFNTGIANQNIGMPNVVAQQNFQNEISKVEGGAGAANNMAGFYGQAADRDAQTKSNQLGAAVKLGSAYMSGS